MAPDLTATPPPAWADTGIVVALAHVLATQYAALRADGLFTWEGLARMALNAVGPELGIPLTDAQRETIGAALSDAIAYRRDDDLCPECGEADLALAVRYARVAAELRIEVAG
jgi:hypothetical protein